ncbi:hypothetical protein CLHUN_29970 [Ruminiclostridium hungatei]|uniref:Uncharacterized protein n=1 Tax=Ruminiclostridium hungatei TaxID=48256 RepID=A0A1V4SII9_RUMHU|nr:hypothetical protein CLHUN_29970 [Ruminiclostridium hungatei]
MCEASRPHRTYASHTYIFSVSKSYYGLYEQDCCYRYPASDINCWIMPRVK